MINVNAPGGIDILAPTHDQELEPANWPEFATGRLSQDVVLDVAVTRGTVTYRGSVTVAAAGTATNASVLDLLADVQAALAAATYTVTASTDVNHPVGSTYPTDPSDPDIKVKLRDSKLLLTSPYELAAFGSSVNADLLGFDLAPAPARRRSGGTRSCARSRDRWSIWAHRKGPTAGCTWAAACWVMPASTWPAAGVASWHSRMRTSIWITPARWKRTRARSCSRPAKAGR